MILDSQSVFAIAQAPTAVGDTPSTNQIDTGSQPDDGIGESVNVVVKVDTAFTSGGAATLQAVLQASADNSTYTDKLASPVFALAALTVGAVLMNADIPIGPQAQSRYLRMVWRIGTAVMTTGAVSAFLVKDAQAYQFGPNGYAVL